MTYQSDSQIGIQSPPVHFAKRNNVESIEHRNQGADNPVDSGGLVRQTDLRRRYPLSRLTRKNGLTGHAY